MPKRQRNRRSKVHPVDRDYDFGFHPNLVIKRNRTQSDTLQAQTNQQPQTTQQPEVPKSPLLHCTTHSSPTHRTTSPEAPAAPTVHSVPQFQSEHEVRPSITPPTSDHATPQAVISNAPHSDSPSSHIVPTIVAAEPSDDQPDASEEFVYDWTMWQMSDSIDQLFVNILDGENDFDGDEMDTDARTPARSTDVSGPIVLSDPSEHLERANAALKFIRKHLSQRFLIAIMAMYGKARLTLESYSFISYVMRTTGSNVTLPSHSTIRQHLLPRLIQSHFVMSSVLNFPVTKDADNESGLGVRRPAIVVKPSSWARVDVACVNVAEDLFCSESHCTCSTIPGDQTQRTIERSAIVQHPDAVLTRCSSFWVDRDGIPYQAQCGDDISIFTETLSQTIMRHLCKCRSFPLHRTKDGFIRIGATITSTLLVSSTTNAGSEMFVGDMTALSTDQRLVLQFLTKHVSLPQDADDHRNPLNLSPGDLCTFLAGECERAQGASRLVPVYLNKFWRTSKEVRSKSLVWLLVSNNRVKYIDVTSPYRVPRLVTAAQSTNSSNTICRTGGVLTCGTPYYIYRVLLYCDDFKPRSLMFPKGSVGGCYMVPIGLSIQSRRSSYSVRSIGLTPHGVSTNHILDSIIDDLVVAATKGVQTRDYKGDQCVVFIEVAGYVADYPASSSVLDVLCHSAYAPCTHCSFRVLEGPRKDLESRFAHSISIHSASSSFCRGNLRTEAMRRSRIGESDCNLLGMKDGDYSLVHTPGLWPFIRLSDSLSNCSSSTHDVTPGNPIPFSSFDGYSRNVIAPDHLLTGISTNLIECVFSELHDVARAKKLDLTVRIGLREVGLEGQRSLYNSKTKKLHSMSMSAKYCVLLILPSALRITGLQNMICFHLIETLQRISSLVFWWPSITTDGVSAFNFVHGDDQTEYQRSIIELVQQYLRDVKILCSQRPDMKVH